MATIDELRKNRFKKLERLKSSGIEPYPEKTKRTHTVDEILKNFKKLRNKKEIVVAVGRIMSMREHGGSSFLHFEDGTQRMQAYLKRDKLGEKGYNFFLENFDIGDFIELSGTLFETKKGERTIEISDFKILTKSLLPLPEKWHGLKDIEERFRKRYLDLLFNPEVKKKFETRSEIIKEIRKFLENKGFLEVETPILQQIYGGAKAKPFRTHLNALDLDLYLRIAPELYLKRLLIAGFERVYEIGRVFRNEGMDRFHNPDYTQCEFYWAYADYKVLMGFVEEMLKKLLKKLFGKTKIKYENREIDFKPAWQRLEFSQFLKKYAKLDPEEINDKTLLKEAGNLGIKTEKGAGRTEIIDEIYKKICRPKIWQPTFVIHHPSGSFPLAKQSEKNPLKLANFQLVIAGWELALGFSELNDPLEQRKRFEEQEKLYKQGFEEAQRIDEDFLEALEYGMPPAAGFGMGIDRLTALLTDSHGLREVILFPTMRPKL